MWQAVLGLKKTEWFPISQRDVFPQTRGTWQQESRVQKFTYLEKSPESATHDRFPLLFFFFLLHERLNLKTILTVMMAVRHRHTFLLLLLLLKAVRPVLQRGYTGNKVGGLLQRPRRKWREERKTRFKSNPFQCVHSPAGVAHCFEKVSASSYYLLAFIRFYSY